MGQSGRCIKAFVHILLNRCGLIVGAPGAGSHPAWGGDREVATPGIVSPMTGDLEGAYGKIVLRATLLVWLHRAPGLLPCESVPVLQSTFSQCHSLILSQKRPAQYHRFIGPAPRAISMKKNRPINCGAFHSRVPLNTAPAVA